MLSHKKNCKWKDKCKSKRSKVCSLTHHIHTYPRRAFRACTSMACSRYLYDTLVRVSIDEHNNPDHSKGFGPPPSPPQ